MKQISSASLLRERKDGSEARVGSVELFFDLVFVFAVTQLSHFLLHHLTPLGAVQTCLLLMAVWCLHELGHELARSRQDASARDVVPAHARGTCAVNLAAGGFRRARAHFRRSLRLDAGGA